MNISRPAAADLLGTFHTEGFAQAGSRLELPDVEQEQQALLAKIDAALARIEDGTYGYCEETGEEIGLARLEARPIATLCLDAQERWELRQRQMGDGR